MGNQVALERNILDLNPGDHLCLIYEKDPLEQMPALIPFIKQGLENNEQFIYIADDLTIDQLYMLLKISKIDVDSEISRGALKLWTRKEWRHPGAFSSKKMFDQVSAYVKNALEAGFNGIRFAVEMTWALGPDISVKKLEHWEATINTIFTPGFKGKIICQYNRQRLGAPVINQAFRTHPYAIINNCLCENTFYEAPLILKDKSDVSRTDWIISQLKKEYYQKKGRKINKPLDLNNLQWGMHICHFYKSKEDLSELLVPYFKRGLENNEMCIWVTSNPLDVKEAKASLLKGMPGVEKYFYNKQMEIHHTNEWYLKNNKLKPLEEVLGNWLIKEKEALLKGFKGIRIAGNTYWLERKDRETFEKYEEAVDDSIHQHKMIAICSYSVDKCTPSDIVDIVSSHHYTFIKKGGKIKTIENNEHKNAEKRLIEACSELENRIMTRTDQLVKSLEEKEILLKEVHHRVKNNMQLISSLIRLQSGNLNDSQLIKVLQESQNRIKSMALIHEAVYNSDNFTTLNLCEYVKRLGDELSKAYDLNDEKTKIEIDINNAVLDIDTSMVCGLILNELISNSIKYAFPGERKGIIKVNFHVKNNTGSLIVKDDGIGMPENFNMDETNTLGIKLIQTLTEQLNGNLLVKNGNGTTVKIEFPVTGKNEKVRYSDN